MFVVCCLVLVCSGLLFVSSRIAFRGLRLLVVVYVALFVGCCLVLVVVC